MPSNNARDSLKSFDNQRSAACVDLGESGEYYYYHYPLLCN